jgi:hypothetical protein
MIISADGNANETVAITPSDTIAIAFASSAGGCRAIYVGVAGNITLVDLAGAVTLFSNVPVGIFRVGATRVNQTGTTATNLVALR